MDSKEKTIKEVGDKINKILKENNCRLVPVMSFEGQSPTIRVNSLVKIEYLPEEKKIITKSE